MARSNPTKAPSYRLHKATGQAVVTINRKDHYLGRHGTPESRLRYERLITAWMQSPNAPISLDPDSGGDPTVAELAAQYLRWAITYYVKDGVETSELMNVKRALRCLRECYASLPAREFSPAKLKACRDRLIADGLARTNVNRYTGMMVRVFQFGVESEVVPSEAWHSLKAVRPLQRGRSGARETEPIGPVDETTVEATLPGLTEVYRVMVRLQLLTGMRPGEICSMTPDQIDRTGPVWIFRPARHKTQHKDKSRLIPIGPKGQMLLRPVMPPFDAQHVFRNARGKAITPIGYRQAIRAACLKAGVEAWQPNQLRHSAATRIREQASLDAAQVILGHSNITTTQVYAEKNVDAAMQIALKIG
jgi:integrase